MIFDFFSELNKILDTEQKLLKYIQENNPEYLSNKKRIYKTDNSSTLTPLIKMN